MSDHECEERVFDGHHFYSCTRGGAVEREGKWYCWQHDPEYVKAKTERRRAKWETEDSKKRAVLARRSAMARVCRGVSTEELNGLEVGAVRRLLVMLNITTVTKQGHAEREEKK